jgi:hypothetical protein
MALLAMLLENRENVFVKDRLREDRPENNETSEPP